MSKASREFQVFVKPIGSLCNLECHYCYYLKKQHLYPKGEVFRMPDDLLEEYIVQHINASPVPTVNFSWHGGEPLLLGLDYFRKIVELQRKHKPLHQRITNGIQTNGLLLDEAWCRFLAGEGFSVGLSLDGPQEMHDRYRVTRGKNPTHAQVMRGYGLLREHRIPVDILSVVHAENVKHPTEVYRFFKQIGAQYLGFLPLVEREPAEEAGVSRRTVPAEAWGHFLCTIFDEWKREDIERVKVQIFEETARTAFGQEHSLCIFRKTCGELPVVEHNGDFFSCDHYVDPDHRLGNIRETALVELLESLAQRAFGNAKQETLPRYCQACKVLSMCNGGCPKDRFLQTPDGEPGLNYLCKGYRQFFTHSQPFVAELSAQWRRQSMGRPAEPPVPPVQARVAQAGPKPGRNDPCPCGSGKKYKKCCGK
jgi:uncharacterized protein